MSQAAASMPSELLQEIVSVVGQEGYYALAWAFGGGKFYVPQWAPGAGLAEDHPLLKALGAARAEAFCRHFCGSDIVLPLGPWRRQAVLDRHKAGESGDVIARHLRISRSWVYEVIAAAKRPPEPDLFS